MMLVFRDQLSYGPSVKTDCNISYLRMIMQELDKKKNFQPSFLRYSINTFTASSMS